MSATRLLCLRVEDPKAPPLVPGSIRRPCIGGQHSVWVSPANQPLIASCETICGECQLRELGVAGAAVTSSTGCYFCAWSLTTDVALFGTHALLPRLHVLLRHPEHAEPFFTEPIAEVLDAVRAAGIVTDAGWAKADSDE